MNQLSDPIQLKAPSCQSNSTHGILNCLKTNFILSLHTSNPSLHSLQPQVLSTTTSESGSDPELEPLATSERSSRKASMSVSCSESHISEMPTSFKSNCKNPIKNHPKTYRERQHSNLSRYLCVLLFEPQALCKVIDLSNQHRIVAAELYYTLLRTTQALEVTHIVLVGCEAVVWSLGLWTGKRSVILNSVCHV